MKGNKKNIENYKPISLIKILAKIILSVIKNTIVGCWNVQQPTEQEDFKRSYSTIDHTHIVKQLIKKCNMYRKNLTLVFVDYSKAFDSLNQNFILDGLSK